MKHQREVSQFRKCLKEHGFKKMNTKGWLDPNQDCWSNEPKNWFASIETNSCNAWVFMAGENLKNTGFPGGSTYSSTYSIKQELEGK